MLVRVAGAARMVQRRGSALLGLAVACAALAASAAPASAATTQAFAFTGTEQTFTVPTGVTSLHVVAVGAKGGNGSDESAKKLGGPGGLGASVEADLPVTPGQVLYVEVGGTGANGSAGGAGGFNGGGASNDGVFKLPGGGGGGATDIRSCSRVALTCAGVLDTLSSRLLIAAGGGGGGSLGRNEQPTGGEGGDAGKDGNTAAELGCSTGSTPGSGGQAGSQTAGGAGGAAGSNGAPSGNAGSVGQGGLAGEGGSNSEPGGGGGGGFFGGGAGGSGNGCGGGGGGGGSSASVGTNMSTTTSAGAPSLTITYTPKAPTTGGGTTTTPPPATVTATVTATLAKLSSLAISNPIFVVGRTSTLLLALTAKAHKTGTTFSFTLDQAATVTIEIRRKNRGRLVRRTCKPATRTLRHKPTCTLSTTRVATLGRKGHLGVNKVAFTGRIGGKPLAPARYLAVFTAKDSAGSSAPQRIAFTVVKR